MQSSAEVGHGKAPLVGGSGRRPERSEPIPPSLSAFAKIPAGTQSVQTNAADAYSSRLQPVHQQ
jgi:hypothetical protein